jgi:hypothetical protein
MPVTLKSTAAAKRTAFIAVVPSVRSVHSPGFDFFENSSTTAQVPKLLWHPHGRTNLSVRMRIQAGLCAMIPSIASDDAPILPHRSARMGFSGTTDHTTAKIGRRRSIWCWPVLVLLHDDDLHEVFTDWIAIRNHPELFSVKQ